MVSTLLFHHLLLALLLAERYVTLACGIVELPAAELTLDISSGFFHGLFKLPLLLGIHWTVRFSGDHRSKGKTFGFPFGHLLVLLLLLQFLLDCFSFIHEFDLILLNDTLGHCIEFLSLALEHLLTDLFMLLDAIGIKLPSAASRTLHKIAWIVLRFEFRSLLFAL